MIFLALAILSSTAVSLALRFSNNTEHSLYGKFVCNYVVCACCALLCFPVFEWNQTTVVLGAFNGFLLVMGLFLMQLSMKLNGIALTSLYGRLGVCVPLIVSIIFFREVPTWIQIFGMIFSFLSISFFFISPESAFNWDLLY